MDSVQQHLITFNKGVLSDRIQNEGIPVTILDESGRSHLSLFQAVLATIRHIKPDVVHTHGYKENLLGGFAAKLNRIPNIVRTYHGKSMIGDFMRYNIIELINAYLLMDVSIAVSNDLKRFLVKHGVPSKRITVVHNGIVPCNKITAHEKKILRKNLGIGCDEKIIGTIGRMVAVKDHITFINGAKLVLERLPKVKFMIVGDGPLKEKLEQYVRDLGISSRFYFTGFREDATDLLQLFDIFVLTSLHEGIPLALLEAMSLGKPVVATTVGGIPEVIKDNVDGILIPSGDSKDIAESCIRIFNDDTLRNCLSKKAQHQVQEKFILNAMVKNTFDVYKLCDSI